jgi:putative IMPACT (imprinted ancient) family translation regulator
VIAAFLTEKQNTSDATGNCWSLATQQDEKELVQRERLAIDEMREILAEMHRD